jgi:hypothetical protein
VGDRLEALRAYSDAGCATGVLAMPLLPGIHDNAPHIHELYTALVDSGVDFVQPGGLTLRPGRQKDYFLARLRDHRPDLIPLYAEIYRNERPSGAPDRRWHSDLTALCVVEHERTGVSVNVPRHIYSGNLERYDELQVYLHHMAADFEMRGTDTRRLRTALGKLMDWLTDRKRIYNRHRSWDYADLSAELFTAGTLEEILRNDRLSAHVREAFPSP